METVRRRGNDSQSPRLTAFVASGETVTLAIDGSQGQLRVDVHDSSCDIPVVLDNPGDAETGRGLMLVTTLSASWGVYRTPAGKAVYFTLAFEPGLAGSDERGQTWGL